MRQALLLLLLLNAPVRSMAVEADRSDEFALSRLFDNQHVQEAALWVHERALQMAPEDRFEYLVDWVLPSPRHRDLRMPIAFSPTNPPPPSDDGLCDEVSTGSRASSGGSLVSPVLDLLRVARELEKLTVLQEQLAQWQPAEAESVLGRQALLTLIAFAEGESSAAGEALERFLQLTDTRSVEKGPTVAELLVFHEGRHTGELSYTLSDAVHRYRPWLVAEYSLSPLKQHVFAILGRLKAVQNSAETGATPIGRAHMSQWSPVSRATAATRGAGHPNARWDYFPGHVENVASHDDDYLYFNTPLRGNFEVECDVTAFGWRESDLMVAGVWIAPVYTHTDYEKGNFRRRLGRTRFEPKMTKVDDWIRYRTVVRNGVATTYFNGRMMHQQPLTPDHDPWLAIRSSWRFNGAVRNLQITGTPEIPEAIRLSTDPQMGGWLSYFERTIGNRDSTWRRAANVEEGGEIRAFKRAGTGVGEVRESLLRYHRPMLEDGTIDYEFYYVPGEVHVHPALDRLAFVLDPSGVKTHWITDGEHDRTGLRPDNLSSEPENRRGAGSLPIRPQRWNHLALSLVEDTVRVTLNGQEVYERTLEATNQRTFGLFHFADRTAARVRNIVWKGDWPTSLVPLERQELADGATRSIDRRLPELTAVFEHDFVAEGLPLNRFTVQHADHNVHTSVREDGLHTWRGGDTGYPHVSITPTIKVSGDFDVVASFSQLDINPVKGGTGAVMLKVMTESNTFDEALLYRFLSRRKNDDEHLVQCSRAWGPSGEKRRHFFSRHAIEAAAGKLRLARRGGRLYYLFAENDSEHFHIIGQEEFAEDDLTADGIQLVTQAHLKGSRTAVLWKNVTVRAEKISGLGIVDQRKLLASLNQQRDQLPARFHHDFQTQPPPASVFNPWGTQQQWRAKDGGLRLVHQGTNRWTSTGIGLRKHLEGDFDISMQLRDIALAKPAASLNSAIYLQVEFADASRTQSSVILSDHANRAGALALAQRRVTDGRGGHRYQREGALEATSVSSLRIARRGETIYYLATSAEFGGEQILALAEISSEPLHFDQVRVILHTGGADRTSEVVWERIDVMADRIVPDSPPAPQPASPVKSVIDFLFR